MAADTTWQLEKETYTISLDHDLIVRVFEHATITRTEGTGESSHTVKESVKIKVHDFKVKRIQVACCSDVFNKLLSTDSGFKDATQDYIELHEDSARILELWFKILHAGADIPTDENATIKDVWEMLAVALKFGINPQSCSSAKLWFLYWYHANQKKDDGNFFGYQDYQALLFPCHAFDYAEGFQRVTKYLVFHANGDITERQPDGFRQDNLRLDSNIISKLKISTSRIQILR